MARFKHKSIWARSVRMGAAFLSIAITAASARAATFIPTSGSQTWNSTVNWSTSTIPNATGAEADFGDPTGPLTVTIDSGSSGFTVGTISFTINSANSNTINTGTTGSKLIMDNGGAGAFIIAGGSGSGTGTGGSTTINPPITLNDNLTLQVDDTNATSAVGALSLASSTTGNGGLTKTGNGILTMTSSAKNYTGATAVNAGRMRMSFSGRPQQTSSFTVNAGGQLDITVGNAAFNLGPVATSSLFLNGTGPTAGPLTNAPGAFRPDPNLILTIPNAVVLQSDSLIHIEGATAATTFSNTVSGAGKLTLTAPSSSATQGVLILNGANTYQGGTLVAGGSISLQGASATLGTGDVEVNNATSTSSTARLEIQSGVVNGIADGATLNLAGGGTASVADQNYIILGSGVNETVGGLVLGGVAQTIAGTYGSTTSGATFQNDEYFNGPGMITFTPVPEPGAAALLAMAAFSASLRRRRHR